MSNSWNYIYVVTSYITYVIIFAYFRAQYMQIDIEYLLFNQNRQRIQIAQIAMILLGVVSIVDCICSLYLFFFFILFKKIEKENVYKVD
jgi:hypothetical protein